MTRAKTTTRATILLGAVTSGLALAGCAAQGPAGEAGETAAAVNPASPSAPAGASAPGAPATAPSASGPAADLASVALEITWQEALAAAQAKFPGQPTEISLDWETNEFAYTVELVSDAQQYEAEVSASSGAIVSESTDRLDGDDVAAAQAEVFDPATVIDAGQAVSAARTELDGSVTEWSLGRSSSGLFYEIDILPAAGGEDVEVAVDATNGTVVGVKR